MTQTPNAQPAAAKTILLVEDDAFIFDIYQTKFSAEGHRVIGAHSGEEALKMLRDSAQPRPDLILCDVVMPGMGGFEFLRQKYEDPRLRDIPTIMLTNVSEREHYDLAERYGAIGYIVKANYTPSEVLRRVLRYLAQHEQHRAATSAEQSPQAPAATAPPPTTSSPGAAPQPAAPDTATPPTPDATTPPPVSPA